MASGIVFSGFNKPTCINEILHEVRKHILGSKIWCRLPQP
jgi:hypothetical protein